MMLIPSPNVAEDHQTRNAMALVANNAAIMIPDAEIDQNLFLQAFSLINNDERLKTLSANSLKLAKPKAAEMIVDEIEKLIGN